MKEQLAICRGCSGRGKIKLPGTKKYIVCDECDGAKKAPLKPEDKTHHKLPNTKEIPCEKVGGIRIT